MVVDKFRALELMDGSTEAVPKLGQKASDQVIR